MLIQSASPSPSPVRTDSTAFLRRPRSFPARAGLIAVNLASITFFLLFFPFRWLGLSPYRIDLDVYRIGGRVWLNGGDLYGRLPATIGGLRLPFTYPPIAATLLSPLSMVPMAVAGTVLTLCSIALTAVVIRMYLPRPAKPTWRSAWVIGWLLPLALFLEPVRNTLAFGQVNILLMTLVSADCLLSAPRWPRGALVGLAAAVKLAPAAFVLYFLLRRDYRAAATAGLSFLVATGAGFIVDWHDSVRYWTSVVFQISRIGGGFSFAGNQSIDAVLARAGLNPITLPGTAVWLGLSAITLAAASAGMLKAFAASEKAWALSLNAFAALLISPISWTHHWVWVVPAIITLAVIGHRRRTRLPFLIAAAGIIIFGASFQWWLPTGGHRELSWAAWQQVTGSLSVIFAALVLLLSAFGLAGTPDGRHAPLDAA